ncbi:MAG: hypothetical protein II771_08485 [Clostridia bacterium]|nr:hypothetical protein [Clostridia bacterium]
MIPMIRRCGIPSIVDSDGDITMAVDWYASAASSPAPFLPAARRPFSARPDYKNTGGS